MISSKTCRLFFAIHILYAVSAQEMEKRVPQGFVGMRGKKFESEATEQFYKRKPQFFVGVKGKKSIFDYLQEPEKRVPMGFVGMRGKKESLLPDPFYSDSYEYVPKRGGSLIGQIDYASSNELKNLDGEEFPILNDLLTMYIKKYEHGNSLEAANDPEVQLAPENSELSNEKISNEVDKRAANIHQFFGVRGKKSIQNKRPYDLTFRGKFIGVRGKKDLKNSGAQEIRFLLGNGPWPKRKAQMGFVGMRGKKWFDESSMEEELAN